MDSQKTIIAQEVFKTQTKEPKAPGTLKVEGFVSLREEGKLFVPVFDIALENKGEKSVSFCSGIEEMTAFLEVLKMTSDVIRSKHYASEGGYNFSYECKFSNAYMQKENSKERYSPVTVSVSCYVPPRDVDAAPSVRSHTIVATAWNEDTPCSTSADMTGIEIMALCSSVERIIANTSGSAVSLNTKIAAL